MTKEFYVQIDSMAYRGHGVARVEGMVFFIPYSVTGDKGRVEIIQEKKNYAIGRMNELLEPSPWRTDAHCSHFGVCGGCHWQHIDYARHGELKETILREILQRIGGLREIPSVTVIPAPSSSYGYRVRVQLKRSGKRLGYHQEKSHRIVDIDHCPISHPLVNQIISRLRGELPSFPPVREIEINVSPEEGSGCLLLHSDSLDQRWIGYLKEFLRSHPMLKGVTIAGKGRWKMLGDPHLHFTVSFKGQGEARDLRLRTSPGSFFQINLEQNRNVIQTVLDFSEVKATERVLDLYAGVGNLTLPLALSALDTLGVEENGMAAGEARFNIRANRIDKCDVILGRVEDTLKNWKKEVPGLVVLDPPRTGCQEVLGQLLKWKVPKIVYVSCAPTTFARDLRILSEKEYRLEKLALIDMFPQTYHLECVGLFRSPC